MVTGYGDGMTLPKVIPNFINGEFVACKETFDKISPANGSKLAAVSSSDKSELDLAVSAAQSAFARWSATPVVTRGMILYKLVQELEHRKQDVAAIVSMETGKSRKDALGETDAAIQLGIFFASEGQRFFGRTTPSGVSQRFSLVTREALGVAALIVPANTPIANIAWKVFPALLCGNTVVLKSSEDSPIVAALFAEIALKSGLPPGVLNIVHGTGAKAGEPLVANPAVAIISFTGSTEVGRKIQIKAAPRLTKVSLELGGKNPFVVCDDANLEAAVRWATLSAFSNAGQRCAAASRIIVMRQVYDEFLHRFVEATKTLKLGCGDADDFGPVIRESHLLKVLQIIDSAKARGAKILTGGRRHVSGQLSSGFFLEPTIITDVKMSDPISRDELFAPVTCVYRADSFQHALTLANDCEYGLTAAIHTHDLNRTMEFSQKVNAGVVSINGGTHGSEPHMPFGGRKASGNGTREPGPEAIDLYSITKNIIINFVEAK
jgi:acyl-CoA reductase-like NAD-dependent aldehyde dehydrogenase